MNILDPINRNNNTYFLKAPFDDTVLISLPTVGKLVPNYKEHKTF